MAQTVVAGSPLRALRWKRPKLPNGRAYPAVLEQGLERLQAQFEKRGGALFDAAARSPVWTGELRDTGHRKIRTEAKRRRRLRSDGATNFCAFLQALVAAADVSGGYLGRPGEQGWDRHTFERIDHYAFGEQVPCERSLRRTERMARLAKSLGLLEVRELKVLQQDGEWRSVPAIKFVTDKLWDMLGLTGLLRAERSRRKREKGIERARVLVSAIGAGTNADRRRQQRMQQPATPASTSPALGRPPAVDEGPPRPRQAPSDTGRAALDQLSEVLGKRRG